MSCFRTSNPKYDDAPPRMDDGRHFTDYKPSCDLNVSINREQKINTSFDMRLYLQRNADQLMNENRRDATLRNGYRECGADVKTDIIDEFTDTMLPEKYTQVCNGSTCEFKLNDPNGLGLGRQYFNNEHLKTLENMNKNLGVNDCRPVNELLRVDGYTDGPELYDIRTNK